MLVSTFAHIFIGVGESRTSLIWVSECCVGCFEPRSSANGDESCKKRKRLIPPSLPPLTLALPYVGFSVNTVRAGGGRRGRGGKDSKEFVHGTNPRKEKGPVLPPPPSAPAFEIWLELMCFPSPLFLRIRTVCSQVSPLSTKLRHDRRPCFSPSFFSRIIKTPFPFFTSTSGEKLSYRRASIMKLARDFAKKSLFPLISLKLWERGQEGKKGTEEEEEK